MAFDELKQNLAEAEVSVRSYLEHSEEYLQLKVFKVLMAWVTTMSQMVLIGTIAVLALFMVSLGISLALNEALDSFYLGFIITGAFYMFVAVLCYFLRYKLNSPLLRKFSEHYFD